MHTTVTPLSIALRNTRIHSRSSERESTLIRSKDLECILVFRSGMPILNKLKSRGFRATNLSTYYFSTLYTTLPHNLIKEKRINLIEWTFKREGSPYIACIERQAFFTSGDTNRYKLWFCRNVCEASIYLLDNICIRFGTKLYRQINGIPMGPNCACLVADLFLFCYERDFMTPSLTLSKLKFLMHLNVHLDIWTTF